MCPQLPSVLYCNHLPCDETGLGLILSRICARHVEGREEIEHPILVDQLHPLCVQPHKMGAVLPAVAANAVIHAEEIRIGAVHTFSERYANFRHRATASTAKGKEIFADDVVVAALQGSVSLDKTEDAASHENVGAPVLRSLDLVQTLIHPIDAIATINHAYASVPIFAWPFFPAPSLPC